MAVKLFRRNDGLRVLRMSKCSVLYSPPWQLSGWKDLLRSGIQRKLLNRQSVISSWLLNNFEEMIWRPGKIIACNYRGFGQDQHSHSIPRKLPPRGLITQAIQWFSLWNQKLDKGSFKRTGKAYITGIKQAASVFSFGYYNDINSAITGICNCYTRQGIHQKTAVLK